MNSDGAATGFGDERDRVGRPRVAHVGHDDRRAVFCENTAVARPTPDPPPVMTHALPSRSFTHFLRSERERRWARVRRCRSVWGPARRDRAAGREGDRAAHDTTHDLGAGDVHSQTGVRALSEPKVLLHSGETDRSRRDDANVSGSRVAAPSTRARLPRRKVDAAECGVLHDESCETGSVGVQRPTPPRRRAGTPGLSRAAGECVGMRSSATSVVPICFHVVPDPAASSKNANRIVVVRRCTFAVLVGNFGLDEHADEVVARFGAAASMMGPRGESRVRRCPSVGDGGPDLERFIDADAEAAGDREQRNWRAEPTFRSARSLR